MVLLADVGLVDDEIPAPALLRKQHTRMVPPQLWSADGTREEYRSEQSLRYRHTNTNQPRADKTASLINATHNGDVPHPARDSLATTRGVRQ